jgi:hypothetical protein
VRLSITAWRLADPGGIPAECTIQQADDAEWELSVSHGPHVVIAERCPSDDAALERSTEIWSVLLDQGWTERRQ